MRSKDEIAESAREIARLTRGLAAELVGLAAGIWRRHRPPSAQVRRMLVWLALLLAAVVAVCWAAVALLGGLPGDAHTAAEIEEERLGGIALAPAHALDWLGHPLPAAFGIAGIALWAWRTLGWRHALLVIAAVGASGVAWLLKELTDRSRPEGAAWVDPSFPSGHTTWAAAVFGIAVVFAVLRRRWALAACGGVVVAVMGPSRVLLGEHWASDVLAGYALGLAWLIGLLVTAWSWTTRDRRVTR